MKIVIFVVYATLCSLAVQPHKISREFILLGGHYDLQTASEVRSDLRFGIYGPNFICYHVCLDSLGLFWPFFLNFVKVLCLMEVLNLLLNERTEPPNESSKKGPKQA